VNPFLVPLLAASLLRTPAGSPVDSARAVRLVAAGDSAYARRDGAGALAHYEEAIAVDSTCYAAWWKTARVGVDLNEFAPDNLDREHGFSAAVRAARRAVAIDSMTAEGHFELARALGREALAASPKARLRYAAEIRAEALRALSLDPANDGALHVMGVWNAQIMRLNPVQRFMARTFMGDTILERASWHDAIRYMERAVAVGPTRIVHHLDLGTIYEDTGDLARARQEYVFVVTAPIVDYNDPHYQADAAARLARLH
jgi:tetratricopeptide (TPR) repeat protein